MQAQHKERASRAGSFLFVRFLFVRFLFAVADATGRDGEGHRDPGRSPCSDRKSGSAARSTPRSPRCRRKSEKLRRPFQLPPDQLRLLAAKLWRLVAAKL